MEKELEKLEQQAEAVIRNYTRIKKENSYLREKQSELLSERDALQKKNQNSAAKLKKLVVQLKAMEG